jgi:hypothetical protein
LASKLRLPGHRSKRPGRSRIDSISVTLNGMYSKLGDEQQSQTPSPRQRQGSTELLPNGLRRGRSLRSRSRDSVSEQQVWCC